MSWPTTNQTTEQRKMTKIGDTVRFLNSVGGGKVVKIDGNLVHVEDADGFQTPVLARECVVVDSQKAPATAYDRPIKPAPSKLVEPEPEPKPVPEELKIEETPEGDTMNLVLAYEPSNLKDVGSSDFTAYLVNDSNYYLYFTYLSRDEGRWTTRYQGIVEPNIQVLLEEFDHEALAHIDRIAVQAIAFKKDKPFAMKTPVNFDVKFDGTRFYKAHCFVENEYFDSRVIAYQLVNNDVPYVNYEIDAKQLQSAMREKKSAKQEHNRSVPSEKTQNKRIIECDLHINELLDSTAGLSNADMLGVQLDKFREVMNANIKRKGAKIVFIHGKGEGVLRKAIIDELKHSYKQCTFQDASFREYGFGATLITIH